MKHYHPTPNMRTAANRIYRLEQLVAVLRETDREKTKRLNVLEREVNRLRKMVQS